MKFNFTAAGRACAVALLSLLMAPAPAAAQLSLVGDSAAVISATVLGVDGGYDPKNNSFLMVGGYGSIFGVCVGPDGRRKGEQFVIHANAAGAFGSFPRARYSPDIDNGNGGFLVVWVQENEAVIRGWGPVYSRVVSCARGVLGPEQPIDPAFAYLPAAAAIAYSPVSKRFLVVFKGNHLTAKAVDNSGAGIGAAVLVPTGGINLGRDPGVAWNSATDDFGVSFSGETYAAFVKMPASNPAAFVKNTVRSSSTSFIAITDIDYNAATNTYAMAFWDTGITRIAQIAADGTLLALRIGSSIFQGYDAVSIAANPVSSSYLLAGVRDPGVNADVAIATELDAHGTPKQAEIKVSTSEVAPPARFTRVVSSTTTPTWNVSWSGAKFAALGNQIVQTSGGGSTPPPTEQPPPPTTSAPLMHVDAPANGATVLSTGFTVAGWAVDTSATSSTGVNEVHVYAQPLNGAPAIFLGGAPYGYTRPDVGTAFAKSYFTGSGFQLTVGVAPGGYDLYVYARSTVAGQFNNVKIVRITVQSPPSNPRMWVDTPVANQTFSQTGPLGPDGRAMNIRVAGWALDLASDPYSTGVDAVHVWAYPTTGADPIFVGFGRMGQGRPDVGAAFGSSSFNNSGFIATGHLPVNDYTLVVYAHSKVANAFNNVFTIPIKVR